MVENSRGFVTPHPSLVASRYRLAITIDRPTDRTISRPTDGTESFTIVAGSSIRDYAGNVLDALEDTTGTLNLQDKKPPVFAGTYPALGTAGGNAVPLKLKVDENGTVHYVVLPKDDTAPTAAQVVAGTNAADTAVTNGTQSLTANTEEIKSVAGLASETDYDIYVVAKDAAGNMTGAFLLAEPTPSPWISSPIKLTLSTLDITPPPAPVISGVALSGTPKKTLGFSLSGEAGATYSYTIKTSGANEVTGTGTLPAAALTDIDLKDTPILPDGDLTISVTLTDAAGNTSSAATDTSLELDTISPTAALSFQSYPLKIPLINQTESSKQLRTTQ